MKKYALYTPFTSIGTNAAEVLLIKFENVLPKQISASYYKNQNNMEVSLTTSKCCT